MTFRVWYTLLFVCFFFFPRMFSFAFRNWKAIFKTNFDKNKSYESRIRLLWKEIKILLIAAFSKEDTFKPPGDLPEHTQTQANSTWLILPTEQEYKYVMAFETTDLLVSNKQGSYSFTITWSMTKMFYCHPTTYHSKASLRQPATTNAFKNDIWIKQIYSFSVKITSVITPFL